MGAVPFLDDGNVAPEATVMLAQSQQQHCVAQKADIDINPHIMPQEAMLGDDHHRQHPGPGQVFEQ